MTPYLIVALALVGTFALVRMKPWAFLVFIPMNGLTAYEAWHAGLFGVSVAQVVLAGLGAYGFFDWRRAMEAGQAFIEDHTTECPPGPDGFCCGMRARFITGVTGIRDYPEPVELVDFVIDWHTNEHRIAKEKLRQKKPGERARPTHKGRGGGPITFKTHYCCFCGARLGEKAPRQV